MTNKTKKVILASLLIVIPIISCNANNVQSSDTSDNFVSEKTDYDNENDALLFATTDFEVLFNPLYYSSTNYGKIGMTQISMFETSKNVKIAFADDEIVVVKDYEQVYDKEAIICQDASIEKFNKDARERINALIKVLDEIASERPGGTIYSVDDYKKQLITKSLKYKNNDNYPYAEKFVEDFNFVSDTFKLELKIDYQNSAGIYEKEYGFTNVDSFLYTEGLILVDLNKEDCDPDKIQFIIDKEDPYYPKTMDEAIDLVYDFYFPSSFQTIVNYWSVTASTILAKFEDDAKLKHFELVGHNLIVHEKLEPSCEVDGHNIYYTCSSCDYTTYQVIAKLGHELVHHERLEPTCTSEGYEAYVTCSRCDYTTYKVIDKLGHDLVHHEGLEPACTSEGYEAYDTCNRCDYSTYKTIAKVPHDYKDTWLNNENGHYHECENCGNIDTLIEHTYSWIIDKDSTCKTTGLKHEECEVCHFIRNENTTIELKKHTIVVDAAIEATCTEAGLSKGSHCSVCNEIIEKQEIIAKKEHTFTDWKVIKEATNESEGQEQRECSMCHIKETKNIPKVEKKGCKGNIEHTAITWISLFGIVLLSKKKKINII